MLTFTNEDLRAKLAETTDVDVRGLDFLPFSDNEESVRADVDLIRRSPFPAKGTCVRLHLRRQDRRARNGHRHGRRLGHNKPSLAVLHPM